MEDLKNWIDRKEIIAVKGPRQSGKTTLLKIFRRWLIEEKEDDAESVLPFEHLFLKAEILRVIGDKTWERWHEKAKRSKRDRFQGLGGSFKGTDMIRVSEKTRRPNQKDKNSENEGGRKEEKKEKTLDEFL